MASRVRGPSAPRLTAPVVDVRVEGSLGAVRGRDVQTAISNAGEAGITEFDRGQAAAMAQRDGRWPCVSTSNRTVKQ